LGKYYKSQKNLWLGAPVFISSRRQAIHRIRTTRLNYTKLTRSFMKQNSSSKRRLITIICPVYNEQESIPIFYNRLKTTLEPLNDRYDFELIFSNNRSKDKTLEVLLALRKKDPCIHILTLSRNFGYQASAQAGMSHAAGEAIIVIDVDCEDPPELIPQFIEKWEDGYDVVCGIRKNRPELWLIKKSRNLFYRLLKITADADIVLYMAEFALISSVVRDAIINNENTFPFLRAEIGFAGFSRFEVPYDRQRRVAGKTHYNLFNMVSFAAAGILTSSTFLMRLAAYMFPFFVLLNLVLLIITVFWGSSSAFKVLVAMDLIYVTFLLTTHGIYLARVYKNVIGRPIYIIDPKKSCTDREIVEKRR